MGLSASQARLLSITTRLSHNELESQMISNSKVRLTDQTQRASEEYIDALSATKLMYTTYDDEGNSTQVSLTPAVMYAYSSAKNQYIIKNNNNQIMVSSTDAKNYEDSATLTDFLDKYGLVEDVIPTSVQQKYEAAMKQYNDDLEQYKKDLEQYNKDLEQYNKDLEAYNNSSQELYNTFVSLIGTSDNHNTETGYCYDQALKGRTGCYEHLIAHLLDWGGSDSSYSTATYTTTNGNSVSLKNTSGGMAEHAIAQKDEFLKIVEALKDETRKCDGVETLNPDLQTIISSGGTPSDKDILISDYIYDSTTNTATELKSLRQKMIDILYVVQNSATLGFTADEMKQSLINFTEGDMKALGKAPEAPTEPVAPTEPTAPTGPTSIPIINDQDKGQWYVNLWYQMNGSDTANLVKKYTDTDADTDIDDSTPSDAGNVYVVEPVGKNTNSAKNYAVLEDSLFTSKEWLQFALEHGCITLSKAQYNNPSEDSGKASEITSAGITWNSIIHTSAVDITTVEDEAAITKAEAEYTNKLNEIEAKDTKYDNEIKKLDTEHNALQTEYESLKTIISKNTERSFKAFS